MMSREREIEIQYLIEFMRETIRYHGFLTGHWVWRHLTERANDNHITLDSYEKDMILDEVPCTDIIAVKYNYSLTRDKEEEAHTLYYFTGDL